VSEAPGYGQSVLTYDPGSRGALAYIAAAAELHSRRAALPGGVPPAPLLPPPMPPPVPLVGLPPEADAAPPPRHSGEPEGAGRG